MIKLKDLTVYFNASNSTSLWLSMDYKENSQLFLQNISYKLPVGSHNAMHLNNQTGKVVKCHALNVHGNKDKVSLQNVFVEGNFTPLCSKENFNLFSKKERGMMIVDRLSNKYLVWNGMKWIEK